MTPLRNSLQAFYDSSLERPKSGTLRERAITAVAAQACIGDPAASYALAWIFSVVHPAQRKHAWTLIERAALLGDPDAQLLFGYRILKSEPARGARLIRRAARSGSARAKAWLGEAHLKGTKPFIRSLPLAERLLRSASKQGHARAALLLGWKRDFFDPDPGAYTRAAKWYRLAAIRGEPDGAHNYAICLERGLGVRANKAAAARWKKKAKLLERHKKNVSWLHNPIL
jgi:TPR repeat protein